MLSGKSQSPIATPNHRTHWLPITSWKSCAAVGHGGVEVLHLVAENGGKPRESRSLDGEEERKGEHSRERGNGRGGLKRRGEVLEGRRGCRRKTKEGLREGQTEREGSGRCDEEAERA